MTYMIHVFSSSDTKLNSIPRFYCVLSSFNFLRFGQIFIASHKFIFKIIFKYQMKLLFLSFEIILCIIVCL